MGSMTEFRNRIIPVIKFINSPHSTINYWQLVVITNIKAKLKENKVQTVIDC